MGRSHLLNRGILNLGLGRRNLLRLRCIRRSLSIGCSLRLRLRLGRLRGAGLLHLALKFGGFIELLRALGTRLVHRGDFSFALGHLMGGVELRAIRVEVRV